MNKWKLIEDFCHYDTVVADTIEEALDIARSNVNAINYYVVQTIWIDVCVVNVDSGETETDVVALNPCIPKCSRKSVKHDWQSPIEFVGGIEENPGCFGHGGGIIFHEVCMNCGCGRITDTWAQNPINGIQGLESVEYIVDEFSSELKRAS